VSERLRRYGRSVLIGDLVVRRENADLIEEIGLEDGGAVAADEAAEGGDQEEGAAAGSEGAVKPTSAILEVTEANIAEYTIEDVVMPMIGHEVRLPPNAELAQIYQDLLTKEGITLENFSRMAS